MERIKTKLKCSGMLAVGCMGEGRKRRGGVALLWRNDWDVDIQSYSHNHIDAVINNSEHNEWRFTR